MMQTHVSCTADLTQPRYEMVQKMANRLQRLTNHQRASCMICMHSFDASRALIPACMVYSCHRLLTCCKVHTVKHLRQSLFSLDTSLTKLESCWYNMMIEQVHACVAKWHNSSPSRIHDARLVACATRPRGSVMAHRSLINGTHVIVHAKKIDSGTHVDVHAKTTNKPDTKDPEKKLFVVT
jgi:hypothetical protein